MKPSGIFYMMRQGDEGLQMLDAHLKELGAVEMLPEVLRQLEFWADCAESRGFWRGALRLFLHLAGHNAAEGNRERCAYRLNDVGILLERARDPRCIQVYHRALALTRDPRRRLRTLTRLGRAHFVIRDDAAMARRCLTAAVLIGWSLGERHPDGELAETQLQTLLTGAHPALPAPDEELSKAAAMFDFAQLPSLPR